MKKLLITIVVALFIFGCGGSSMEKDAKKGAEMIYKLKLLQNKAKSGDASALAEYTKFEIEGRIEGEKLDKKYAKDFDKWNALINEELLKLSRTSEPESATTSEPESAQISDEFTNPTKEILKTHIFTKITSLTSLIAINFDETHFTFRVIATNGTELSRASGSYRILPGIDGTVAKIGLIQEGSIQKSPMYADSNGIDTELFLHFNRELLLTKPTEKSLSYFNAMELMTMEKKMPEYFLLGRDAFSSSRLNTQAEKDSIANEERKTDEKKKIGKLN